MSKAKDNGQTEDDILRCKEDILRLRRTNSAGEETTSENAAPKQPTEESTVPSSRTDKHEPPTKDKAQARTDQTSDEEQVAKPVNAPQKPSEIPRFDLAQQILAEQRRITAVRRKAPGKANQTEQPSPPRTVTAQNTSEPSVAQPEPPQIIKQIVATDIDRMLRSQRQAKDK